ncbi:hypothetical protein AWC13_09225 [Mycobacterium kubicae]|nr:hypothetical protein AWC13_09225 [Mycobacterium kubicae]
MLSGIIAIGGTVALANAWNPIGWATGIVVAGVGVAGSLLGMIGGHHGETAEKQRAEARSKAGYAGKTAIQNTFDAIEKEFARQTRAVAWRAAAPNVKALLREVTVISRLRQQAATIVTQLDAKAESISVSPAVDLLDAAERALLISQGANRGDKRDAERLLLGEDWFEAATAPDDIRSTDRVLLPPHAMRGTTPTSSDYAVRSPAHWQFRIHHVSPAGSSNLLTLPTTTNP